MKILFATYWYLPHVGGVNNYVELLKKHFQAQGHHVDVLAHHPDMKKIWMTTTGRYIEKAKVKDYVYEQVLAFFNRELPLVDPWIRWREIERYTYELCALLFGLHNYDVIHTQDIVSTRAIARVRPPHVTHVATIHGILATEYLLAGEIKSRKSMPFAYAVAEEFYGFTSAHRTAVPCQWLRDEVAAQFGVPRQGLDVLPYGIDVDGLLRRARERPGPLPPRGNRTVLLCPARLVPVKGHRVLIDAVARLPKRKDVVVWLAGDGELRDDLKQYVAHLGLEDTVLFLGARSDTPALMRVADIIVLPSLQDTMPFTVMEAQVLGKPIVATRVGGIPEMIESGRTGVLVPPGDASGLARALQQLVENPALRRQLGKRAAEWGARAWSAERMARRVLQFYERAMAATRS